MQARAVRQGPSQAGLFVGEAVAERESHGEVVACGGLVRVAVRRETDGLAGVGREGTRERNPEKTTQLLGGAHRMSAAMQVTNTIEPLNG